MLPKRSVALFDCMDADGDVSDIAEAIVTFADECQATLNLTSWPGLQTCLEFEGDVNLYPYMNDYCAPTCIYGGRSSSSSVCDCDEGYWGPNCDDICPGGAVTPCSGYGSCDITTGACDCPINRQGSDDCSVCSSGWYGSDCIITVNTDVIHISPAFATTGKTGMIYTLDGLTYFIQTHGEFLLLAIADNVIIEGKFVNCYQNYSCLPFITARIGDSSQGFASVTVQSQPTYNSKPLVYIDNTTQSLDTPAYFHGFSVSRSNQYEVNFEVTNHFSFSIRVEGQYLQLTVNIPDSLVSLSSGLLSGQGLGLNDTTAKVNYFYGSTIPTFNLCSSGASVQHKLSSASSHSLSLSSYTQNQTANSTMDLTRFIVSSCDCILFYPSAALQLQTQGGYSLTFDGSSIYRELYINTSVTPSITIEILVKQTVASGGGLIFATSGHSTFMLISGDSNLELHQYMGGVMRVVETNITLEQGEWNKIILTYSSTTGAVALYVIDKDGAVSRIDDTLSTDLFNDTVILSIGHWHTPSDGITYTIPKSLQGTVENFMIWNTAISSNNIAQLWQMNPVIASGSLLFSWDFNEGDGNTVTDIINQLSCTLPDYPWKSPEWNPSDLTYTSDTTAEATVVYFSNSTLKTEAVSLCDTNLLSVSSLTGCTGLPNATRQAFYAACLISIAKTESKTGGYNTILDLYKICEDQHGMASTERTSFCSGLSTVDRNATACTISCVHGYELSNGSCACFTGYYGSQCDSVCPGSSDNPCSGHGECLSTGNCSCWWNWQGASDCSQCSSSAAGDMKGPDCTILDTSSLSSSSNRVAAVSSNGYYMTFGGQQVTFQGEAGAFLLFKSTALNMEIHIYQVGCQHGSCVAAVSLATATTNLVIAPPGQGYAPILYRDGVRVYLTDKVNVFDATMTVTQNSLTEISVTATSIGSITFSVLVQQQYLQAAVTTASTVCQSATGIFGDCTGSAHDYSSYTAAETSNYVSTNFKLTSSVIADVLNVPLSASTSQAGYALSFDHTAVMSEPLSYPSGFSLANTDFSLSLYFKPYSYGGYIMSYGKDITFAVINTNPISIIYDGSSVSSIVAAELNAWNQVVFTFKRATQQIELYYFGENTTVTHEILNLDCPNLFEAGGTVVLGDYAPSQPKYTFGTDHYTGLIDEVSIWKSAIPTEVINQANKLNLKLSGFLPELSTLLSFSEGVGTVASDEVSGNNMAIPKSPWQSPQWIVSDLGLQSLRTTSTIVYTGAIDPTAEAMCSQFFDSSTVSSNCGSISAFIRWWYKENCMFTASSSGNSSDTTLAMADFTSLCAVTGGSTSSVYTAMCSLNVTLPGWLAQKCSSCDFGYSSNGSCVCYYGYYGSSCDQVCPGGAATPCNSHGTCDTSGTCQCSGHWTGSSCDSCITDWTGTECTIMVSSSYDPINDASVDILVAQVNLLGQVSGFDGVIFDMPTRDYVNLLTIPSLDVSFEGRFSVCDAGTYLHVCLLGFIIRHGGESYYVGHSDYTGSSVKLVTAVSTQELFGTLSFGTVTLKLESPVTMTIEVASSSLLIKVSSISNSLLVTFSLSKTEWNSLSSSIDGITTACDMAVAIKAANCSISRASICSNPSQTLPRNCELNQTASALAQYVSNYLYNDTSFTDVIEAAYLAPLESNCMLFSGGGVEAPQVTLPASDFTLEVHTKPTARGTILLAYTQGSDYFILGTYSDGLRVILPTAYHQTYIPLKENEWNQISLAYRKEAEIMEIYLTNSNGKS